MPRTPKLKSSSNAEGSAIVGCKAPAGKDSQQSRAKNVLATITPASIKPSSLVRFVHRCKYQGSDNAIVPQRPAVHFKSDVRIPAKTLVQLI